MVPAETFDEVFAYTLKPTELQKTHEQFFKGADSFQTMGCNIGHPGAWLDGFDTRYRGLH
jgi:hypothetical protein